MKQHSVTMMMVSLLLYGFALQTAIHSPFAAAAATPPQPPPPPLPHSLLQSFGNGTGGVNAVTVGVLLPFTLGVLDSEPFETAYEVTLGFLMALYDLQPLLSDAGLTVNPIIRDDQSTQSSSFIQGTALIETDDAIAVVGEVDSDLSLLLAGLGAKFRRPIISPVSGNPALTSATHYPTFVRGGINDNAHVAALCSAIDATGWDQVGIIASVDAFGLATYSAVSQCLRDLSAGERPDIQVMSSEFIPHTVTATTKLSIDETNDRIQRSGVRVIIFCGKPNVYDNYMNVSSQAAHDFFASTTFLVAHAVSTSSIGSTGGEYFPLPSPATVRALRDSFGTIPYSGVHLDTFATTRIAVMSQLANPYTQVNSWFAGSNIAIKPFQGLRYAPTYLLYGYDSAALLFHALIEVAKAGYGTNLQTPSFQLPLSAFGCDATTCRGAGVRSYLATRNTTAHLSMLLLSAMYNVSFIGCRGHVVSLTDVGELDEPNFQVVSGLPAGHTAVNYTTIGTYQLGQYRMVFDINPAFVAFKEGFGFGTGDTVTPDVQGKSIEVILVIASVATLVLFFALWCWRILLRRPRTAHFNNTSPFKLWAFPNLFFCMLVGTVFQLVLVAVVGSTATRASCSIAFWLRHFGYCLNIGSLTVLLFRYIHFKRDATPFTRWLKRDFAQFQALAMTAVVVMVLFIFQIFVMATNADLVSEVVITPATLSNRLQIVELCSYYQSGWHIALVSLEALPVLTLFASAIQFFVNHETLEDTFYATEMWYGVLIVAGFYVLQVFELVARHFASSAIDFGFAIESLTTLIPISAELALIFERRRRIELSTTAVGAIQNHFVTLEDDDPSDELSKSGVSPSYNPDPLRLDVAQMQVIFDALSSVGQNDAGAAADSRHYHLQGSESPWLRFESGLRERFRVALRRSTAF